MRWIVFIIAISSVYGEKERVEDGGMASKIRSHRDHHIDAQAIIGSRKEADAMGSLSTEESKKRLVAVAKKIDEDKDGKMIAEDGERRISKEELTKWIVKAIKAVDEEEADERMREVDVNGDSLKLLSEDEKYFKAADLDKDGLLTRAEFAAFLTPENYEHMHAVLAELTSAEKDEDGDGAISLKEYLGEMSESPHSEWYKVEAERFSKEYDLNGDGVLIGDEVTKWLIPNVEETAKSENDHIFERADIDKDGYLSYEEVSNQYELFVESEATRYGQHLDEIRHDEL
ncbi:calu-2 [Pristionchus pacificus]|uniref:Calu-2 n=1 Tax=Pristionchus pacificus TaxID=54126 RepID=A0A2A6CCT4_PRIPA|nr:calu-2 [Pristionchus pacificus]|eukprot:PDM75908.1 calu-2 [Pristionchus pacificus]